VKRFSRRAASRLAPALLLAAMLPAGMVAAADVRRIESVGVVPIDPGNARRNAPRDAAVRAAVARGVESVALALLPEGWERQVADPEVGQTTGPPGDVEPLLASALGSDAFDYATRFRILEDRGIRPALLTKDPGAEKEYVVLVEVFVDADRIGERLQAAGLIGTPAGQDSAYVRLVLEGLDSFGAYDALRRTLLEDPAVRSALPVELSAGRAVLEVDSSYDAESLGTALVARSGNGLRVVPVERDGQTLTLLVDYQPPPTDRAAEPPPESGGPPADAGAPPGD
jgi:hypothetical protein